MLNDEWLADSLSTLHAGDEFLSEEAAAGAHGIHTSEINPNTRARRIARIRSLSGFICPVCFLELPSDAELRGHYAQAHAECGDGGSVAMLGVGCGDGYWAPRPTQALGVHRTHMSAFRSRRHAHRTTPDATIQEEAVEWKVLLLEKLMYGEQLCRPLMDRREYEEGIARWADDAAFPVCPVCSRTRFGVLTRRHHCRLCGTVMCCTCSLHLTAMAAERVVNTFLQYDRRRTAAVCRRGERIPVTSETQRPTAADLGKGVWVDGLGKGTLRYVGPAEFAHGEGLWYGIELATGRGWTNGSMHGVQYFACHQQGDPGIFAPAQTQGVVLNVTLYDGTLERVPEIKTVRVCTRCAGDMDTLCTRADAKLLFAAERAISHSNPPEVLMIYRDMEPVIIICQPLHQVRMLIQCTEDQYAQTIWPFSSFSLALAARLIRLEELDTYAEVKAMRVELVDAIRVLANCAQRLRKLKQRGGKTAADAHGLGPQDAGHSQHMPDAHEVAVGNNTVQTTADVDSVSLVNNMLSAIEIWSFAIPRDLLKLPTAKAVTAARLRLARGGIVGGAVDVLEYHHKPVPSGSRVQWSPGRRREDPAPFDRMSQTVDGRGRSDVHRFTTGTAASIDAIAPHEDYTWEYESRWHRVWKRDRADAEGWQYGTALSASSWSRSQGPQHTIRRRMWTRMAVPTTARAVAAAGAVGTVATKRVGVKAQVGQDDHDRVLGDRWIDGRDVDVCMCCQIISFNVWTWKHHCRYCGRVVCDSCSQARTRHPILKRSVRTCADCVLGEVGVLRRERSSAAPMADVEDPISTTGTQDIVEVWECERYEGVTWSMRNLRPSDGAGWKTPLMQRSFTSLAEVDTTLPRGSKWISARWFLESDRWMYAVDFAASLDGSAVWTYTYAGIHQVRRKKWIRRVWTQ